MMMRLASSPERDAAFRRESEALLAKHMPSLEAVTTTAATGIVSMVIMHTECDFDIREDRQAIQRVMSDLLTVVMSAAPLVAAQALGLLSDEHVAALQKRATETRQTIAQLLAQRR